MTLTRSAWAGQQRYGAFAWSGDTRASWATFRAQISGGLNVGMGGQPYWTQDTGGFFVSHQGGERNPAYRELFARWHQFGIFNPSTASTAPTSSASPITSRTRTPRSTTRCAAPPSCATACCPTTTAWPGARTPTATSPCAAS